MRRPAFAGPDAVLSRGDRVWLRRQVAENRSVPVASSLLAVLMVVRSVRAAVWSRRAGRWLALHA